MREIERQSIPIDDNRKIEQMCREQDDELRWIIALLSDTGMRLGEAIVLLKSDINLCGEIPHIDLKPHPWRRLKTPGSERQVPLVGASLWAAKRALDQHTDTKFVFPKYCSDQGYKTNSASAALNKWFRHHAPKGRVVHSFRHSVRDRLRATECSANIIDKIGGWSTAGVGSSYGTGYPIEVLDRCMGLSIEPAEITQTR